MVCAPQAPLREGCSSGARLVGARLPAWAGGDRPAGPLGRQAGRGAVPGVCLLGASLGAQLPESPLSRVVPAVLQKGPW